MHVSRMFRLVPIALAALALLAAAGQAAAAPGLTPASPNVVVILTDDEPALDGRLMNFMPNARALLREKGVRFTDFHVETSLCCPSRAGYLTGQHSHNHGVTRNVAKIFDPQTTLATALDTAGYYTALVGKYFNQYGRIAPTVPPGWDRWAAFGDSRYYEYELWLDGAPGPEVHGRAADDYSTDVLREKTLEVIERAPAGDPLFLWVAPNAPHAPTWEAAPRYAKAACNVPRWRPPNFDERDVTDKPAWVQRRHLLGGPGKKLQAVCRQLLAVDDLIGAVRDALDARGQLENTIFVYAGDNGYHQGEHRIASGKAAPLRHRGAVLPRWPGGDRHQAPRRGRASHEHRLCADDLRARRLLARPVSERPDEAGRGQLRRPAARNRDHRRARRRARADDRAGLPTRGRRTAPSSRRACRRSASGTTSSTANGDRELYDISHGPCWAWHRGLPGDPCRLTNRARYQSSGALVTCPARPAPRAPAGVRRARDQPARLTIPHRERFRGPSGRSGSSSGCRRSAGPSDT